MFLEKLGIFGWKEKDESLLMASILTGDPLLLIGTHGTAKTHAACKIAEALGKKFLAYDASKALFEDVLGYPDIERLKAGEVRYIPSKVTVWDKDFVLIDELNRALPEMQNKWLEIIRSRKIMGFDTAVKWVWAAMNPVSYSATQELDEALVGRFALFVYPPQVLEMSEDDRIKVTTQINGDDAPSLSEWTDKDVKTVGKEETAFAGKEMVKVLKDAARHFVTLKETMKTISEFLAKFADLLMRETKGEITLDGRRLGFIYRTILANRAVELARAQLGHEIPGFVESAKYAVQSSIPIGLNDETVNREEPLHKMEICFDLLSSYFDEGSEISKVNLVYELFTTKDLMRKAEILLKEDVSELAKSKAWNDLMEKGDITLLAYVALQVEAHRPGTIPAELIEALGKGISISNLSSASAGHLEDESVEFIEEIEGLMDRKTDLEKLVAFNRARELLGKGRITTADIEKTERLISKDLAMFAMLVKGGSYESIQAAA